MQPVAEQGHVSGRDAARRLHELRHQEPDPEERIAEHEGGHVGDEHGAVHEHADVHHRRGRAQLHPRPRDGERCRHREEAEDAAPAPAPAVALGEREEQGEQRAGQQQRAREIERSALHR